MADHRHVGGRGRHRLAEVYPDPTDDEVGATPYPALRTALTPSGAYNNDEDIHPGAAAQYRLLSTQLPDVLAGETEDENEQPADEDLPEGMPMANTYLNLRPQLQEADGDDFTADETEIEGLTDVENLAQASQSTTPARKGRKGWKWALKGTAHDPKLNKKPSERPIGRPRGSGKGRGRGRRRVLDPGQDFKEAQSKGTKAYLEGRLDEALDFAREAVQANPEIFSAHSLLAEILQAQGKKEDSLAAFLSGAVVARDPGTWIMVAEQTLSFTDNPSPDILQQAIFCYTQAIDLEKNADRSFHARVSKMQLWLELGAFTKARRDCKALINLKPDDLELVRQLAQLCSMTRDAYEISQAKAAYEKALHLNYDDAYDMSEETLAIAWSNLNIYLELVDRTATPAEAVVILKRFTRKFLGRGDEDFWDHYQANDCELDLEHTRRYEIVEFQQGRASRDRTKYGENVPLEIRVKLGLFRLKMGKEDHDEALSHLNSLLAYKDDADTVLDMFFSVASALTKQGEHAASMPFYEPVTTLEESLTDEFWMTYATSLRMLDRFEEAADCYRRAADLNEFDVKPKIELARLYQSALNDNEKAYQLVDEIIAINKRDLIRREQLHMRPKRQGQLRAALKALEKNRANKTLESSSSSDESDDDEGDGGPVRPRKRRRTAIDDDIEIDENELDANLGPEEREKEIRRLKRRKRHAMELQKKVMKSNERKMAALESFAAKVAESYAVVQRLWPELEHGTDEAVIQEWHEAAVSLYEVFRSVKAFYPSRDKHKPFMGFLRREPGQAKFMNEMELWRKELENNNEAEDRNEDNDDNNDRGFNEFYAAPKVDDQMPKDFYQIPFKEWHHIFVDLALLYARQCRQKACYSMVDDGLYGANVFYHDESLLVTTQATSLCCGFIFNDSERLCFAARWFLNRHDLRPGSTFQLLSAVNRLSFGNSLWFSAGPTQKHMLRSIKALDYHVFPPETRKKFDWSLQLPALKKRVEKYGEGTGLLDANALLTYGHMVGVANHSQSALPYFFRAFALQPENISVNLSIATMYIQNAMKRQTDNRQYGIAQGLSFLYRYYDLRMESEAALDRQEAEYNLGRTWHMLGLTHLALPAYERALKLDESVRHENEELARLGEYAVESFTREAAFALINIYAIAGNDETARRLTEKYLVL